MKFITLSALLVLFFVASIQASPADDIDQADSKSLVNEVIIDADGKYSWVAATTYCTKQYLRRYLKVWL